MPVVEGYFDGACEPVNPGGHAAWGAMVRLDGVTVYAEGGYCGHGKHISNNVAEYSAVIAVMKECLKHEGICILRGDSKLVVMQLNGKWKVKKGLYLPYYREAKLLWDQLRHRAKLEWIPREANDECDYLSKNVLKELGVAFRLQSDRFYPDSDNEKPVGTRKPKPSVSVSSNPIRYKEPAERFLTGGGSR